MKHPRLLATAVVLLAGAPAAQAQRLNPSGPEIFNTDRTLQPAEVAIVVAAARQAISGKTLRLSYVPNGPGPEVLMGANGRPRFVRATSGYDSASVVTDQNGVERRSGGHVDVITFTEYTGRLAQSCEGKPLGRELVFEYELKSSNKEWTARARTRSAVEPLWPAFDILGGSVQAESGGRRAFEQLTARALVAPWKPPAGAVGGPPPGTVQSLWIDLASMLPVRWSISVPALPQAGTPAIPDYGLSFTYDPSLDVSPPNVDPPRDCVP